MNATVTLLAGAALGMAASLSLVPLTGRALNAAVARAGATDGSDTAATSTEVATPATVDRRHRIVLAALSGVVLAYVVHRAGWSANAVPPLLLVVGLIQLAYCDLMRRLLPKELVYLLSGAVIASGLTVAVLTSEWQRLRVAALGGLALFGLLFVINLVNPRWIAFGDVRLALVVGFGLAWVSPMALVEGFFVANVLGAVIGLALIAAHRAKRDASLPFGLYLALGTAVVLVTWS